MARLRPKTWWLSAAPHLLRETHPCTLTVDGGITGAGHCWASFASARTGSDAHALAGAGDGWDSFASARIRRKGPAQAGTTLPRPEGLLLLPGPGTELPEVAAAAAGRGSRVSDFYLILGIELGDFLFSRSG